MAIRVKLLISIMLVGAALTGKWVPVIPASDWVRFAVDPFAIFLGLKLASPKSDGAMSFTLPFTPLDLLHLSLGEKAALAALSVFVQCHVRVLKPFTTVLGASGIASPIAAATFAYSDKQGCLSPHFDARETVALCQFAEAS